tara:strand:- start:681 stop:1484 length:804 start_codon:yes stop_codon:yes gene_type:complete
MKLKIFDTKATIISKKKALKKWNEHNFLYKKISLSVLEKIKEIKKQFTNVLLITSDKDELSSKMITLDADSYTIINHFNIHHTKNFYSYNFSKLEEFLENKKFEQSFDLIVSNLCLHRINDVIFFTSSIKKLLKKNGLYFCSYFGGRSLFELRECLIKTDDQLRDRVYQRVIPFIDIFDAANIHSKVGFSEIVSDKTIYNLEYSNILKLLNDIKGMGENSCLVEKFKGLMTKKFILELEKNYKKKFITKNYKLKVTCETIFLVMWKN